MAKWKSLISCSAFIHRSVWFHINNNGNDVILCFPIASLWHYVTSHFQIMLAMIKHKSSQSRERTWLKENFLFNKGAAFQKKLRNCVGKPFIYFIRWQINFQLWLVASISVSPVQFLQKPEHNACAFYADWMEQLSNIKAEFYFLPHIFMNLGLDSKKIIWGCLFLNTHAVKFPLYSGLLITSNKRFETLRSFHSNWNHSSMFHYCRYV